jgi:hypothetical protein
MSEYLLVLAPVALLVIVSSVCFVGCVLHTSGLPPDFTTYSNDDVVNNDDCVAYWPLSEGPGSSTAVDTRGKKIGNEHDGAYVNSANSPTLYPCPSFTVGGNSSALAPGDMTLGVAGLLRGDAVQPANDPNVTTSAMSVNGGCVSVSANDVTNPPAFSVEAWVSPNWDAPGAIRTVVNSFSQNGSMEGGFSLFANESNQWEAEIFFGTATPLTVTGASVTAGMTTYLVLTFDGLQAILFVNGVQAAFQPAPAGGTFLPNTTAPLTIGAAGGNLPNRTMPTDQLFFPCFPFNGTIQSVAIYKKPLDSVTVSNHFNNGNGESTG